MADQRPYSDSPPGPRTAPPPAGWYPDPSGTGDNRYWDGTGWTHHVGPVVGRAPSGRTSGFAIASLVSGIFGGFVIAILSGVVARRRISQSGGRIRGRGLATAGIVLGCIWALVIGIMFALAASGALDTDNARRYEGDERDVARTVDETQGAFSRTDGDRLCTELFTAQWADLIARGGGRTCPEQIRHAVGGMRQADITVERIAISGDTAVVDVDEGGTPGRWTMVRQEGRWRIDDIEVYE